MNAYSDNLEAFKQRYPFERWRAYWQQPDEQQQCNEIEQAFDQLLAELVALGPDATEAEKVACFQTAIEATNASDGIIETGEREDLCELTNQISVAAGLDPAAYGDGEGLASEWRDW
ncbi:hypothetical protein D0N36_05465 [Hymenobacter lapidiphilus]|uniref:hypothetical protein n=1 Tax=Hymenobacter sp. CCM 8763 TaxID=2303334 RepID=UPI000E348787|nr:hypothetical protein [Hymenobacter sp. CCM 8763]RFP66166.1 hypothetical protein D0N36_05465 [Hymenobacter sp. CCM 8763]